MCRATDVGFSRLASLMMARGANSARAGIVPDTASASPPLRTDRRDIVNKNPS
jgi:hypothetical protein